MSLLLLSSTPIVPLAANKLSIGQRSYPLSVLILITATLAARLLCATMAQLLFYLVLLFLHLLNHFFCILRLILSPNGLPLPVCRCSKNSFIIIIIVVLVCYLVCPFRHMLCIHYLQK